VHVMGFVRGGYYYIVGFLWNGFRFLLSSCELTLIAEGRVE
jgi:hypothetical protein